MEVEPEDMKFLLRIYEDFLVDKFGLNVDFKKLNDLKRKYKEAYD